MMEIILLIGAISTIAAYARGRGGSPWLWGSIAAGGYVLLGYGLTLTIGRRVSEDWRFAFFAAGWVWVGLVALCTRFGLGAGRPKFSRMWTCPNWRYLNAHFAVVCEAGKQRFGGNPGRQTMGG